MKSLISFILAIIPLISQAGNPSQDEIVRQLRSKIVRAVAPTVNDLSLGDKWLCLYRTGIGDNFGESNFVISFDLFDGFISPTQWELDGNSKLPDAQQWIGLMALTPQGLVSNGPTDQIYTVRKNLKGDLLMEVSSPGGELRNRYNLGTSVFDANRSAWGYAVCPKDKILPKQESGDCVTEEGIAIKFKQFKATHPVPSCGPQCANAYIMSQVCPTKK
jgi:hypothetical protein